LQIFLVIPVNLIFPDRKKNGQSFDGQKGSPNEPLLALPALVMRQF
jgi:hypothetical protein